MNKEIEIIGAKQPDNVQTVIIGSTNPTKIKATQKGFQLTFPQQDFRFEGISVPSGVSDQPASDQETYQGAWNRAKNALKAYPQADYWVGIEGGIEAKHDRMEAFAWIFVLSNLQKAFARTASFLLPAQVANLILNGFELGDADDQVFNRTESKKSNGAVGLLTDDLIDRTDYYAHAVILALIPFKKPELYT